MVPQHTDRDYAQYPAKVTENIFFVSDMKVWTDPFGRKKPESD